MQQNNNIATKPSNTQELWAHKALDRFSERKGLNLNDLGLSERIAAINQHLGDDPLPTFLTVTPEELVSGVLSHITFFQRLIKELLPPKESAALWQQAYLLWQHVEIREIEPFYALTKLAALIKEANQLLEPKWQLPLLDLDAYQL